jgi:allophanate hydrolase
LPFGITLVGQSGADRELLALAARLHAAANSTLGATNLPLNAVASQAPTQRLREGDITMAVCGAHMQGLPLNHQLRDRGGYLIQTTRTAARYRLFALPGGPPQRPGLIRVSDDGQAIELEVWGLPSDQVGSFIVGIPAPLGIGKIELDGGAWVTGFVAEGYAAQGASDISSYGGWRAYLKAASV